MATVYVTIIAHVIIGNVQINKSTNTNRHGKRKAILGPAGRALCACLAGKNHFWQLSGPQFSRSKHSCLTMAWPKMFCGIQDVHT